LLARVFAVDILVCDRREGRRRVVPVLTEPAAIRSFLASVEIDSDPPPRGPVRRPPAPLFDAA